MDITMLPTYWREKAAKAPYVSREKQTLYRCADELALAYHQDRHNAEFHEGCRFCDWEREYNENYPEGR